MRRYVWGILLLMVVCVVVSQGLRPRSRSRSQARPVEFFPDSPPVRARAPIPPVPPTVVAVKRGERTVTVTPSRKPGKPAKDVPVADDTAVTRQARFESKMRPGNAPWNEVYDKAVAWLTHELDLRHPVDREFFTRHNLVKSEEIPGPDVEGIETRMIVMDVNVTRAAERELLDANRRVVSAHRLEMAGRGAAVLTVLLGAVAGFVRLDEWTKGYYTKRLVALIGGLVLAATALIVSAS